MPTNIIKGLGSGQCYYCKYTYKFREENKEKLHFHRFPRDRKRCMQWIRNGNFSELLNIEDTCVINKSYYICNQHFSRDQFLHQTSFRLLWNAVPTIFKSPNYNEEHGLDSLVTEATDHLPYNHDLDSKHITIDTSNVTPVKQEVNDLAHLNDITLPDVAGEHLCSTNFYHSHLSAPQSSEFTQASPNFDIFLPDIKEDNLDSDGEDTPLETTNICRLCAVTGNDLINIFGTETLETDLCEKINYLLPIKVTEDDVLPLQVCRVCVENLETAHQLWKTCANSDDILRILFRQDTQVTHEGVQTNETTNDSYGMEDDLDLHMELSSPMEEMHEDLPQPSQVPSITSPQLFCYSCNLEIPLPSLFISHQRHAHGKIITQCKYCITFFSRFASLKDHMQEVHADIENEKLIAKRKRNKLRRQAKKRETPFTCKTCNLQFPVDEKIEYMKHLSEHRFELKAKRLASSNIVCDYCDMKFVSEISKKFHMSHFHTQYKPFACTLCNKVFHLKNSLKSHLATHNQERSFLCEVCAKPFYCKDSLGQHIRYSHQKKLCNFCGVECSTVLFRKHLDNKHLNERNIRCKDCGHSFYTSQELSKHEDNHKKFPFTCYICGGIYRMQNALYSHMQSHKHVVSKNFICPVSSCRLQFESTGSIIKHCDTHAKQDFPKPKTSQHMNIKVMTLFCSYCNSSFRKLHQYKRHLQMHSSYMVTDLLLTCNICKSNWPDEQSLINHLESHPEAFDFSCRHCLLTFVSDTRRTDHERHIHARGRRCDVCFQIFKSINHLEEHKSKHGIKLKTLKCPLCDKMFSTKKRLSKHKPVHEDKSLICSVCSKVFRWPHDLKKHYFLLHTNEKMYKCDKCEFSSNLLKDVESHKSYEHEADSTDSDYD